MVSGGVGMVADRAKAARVRTTGTCSAVILRPVFAYLRTIGVGADAILADIGLTAAMLDEFDRRIPEASRHRAWEEGVVASRDPVLGLHVAESADVGAWDVLDYSMSLSATYGDALDHFRRFHRLLTDTWDFKFESSATLMRLRCTSSAPRQEVEVVFAVLVLRARALTGRDIVPNEVSFSHAAPDDTSPHAALFRSRVRFGAPGCELVFATKDLALPIRTANPGLNVILERYMAQTLARLPKNESFVERARSAVAHTLVGGRPTLEATARVLHASSRTVQRRLEENGTSHVEVVDSVRRDLAERLVKEGRMSITEIAFLLGFADVSGFRRVYKRWTGVAPSRGRMHA
jgi:AraC-like DNA-binding protein